MFMRYLLACSFILTTLVSFSQIVTPVIKADAFKTIALRKESTDLAFKINISRLTILDSRDDTSSLGYTLTKMGVKKYVFEAGFVNELSGWFSQYLNINKENKTGTTLFVNIKKLRLSNEATPIIFNNGHAGQPNNGWEKGIITKIEYYLQKDSFFTPLYRFDSIISLKGNIKRNADDFILTALKLSLDKLFTLNLDDALLYKKKILLSNILQATKRNYDLPVYTSPLYKKGVYINFEEFKTNTPSLTDFELRKGEMGDILYIKENGNEYPTRGVWGYCDGQFFFINSGDKYSRLVRDGYSFYFAGIKSVRRKTKHNVWKSSGLNYATDTGEKTTAFDVEQEYYQVDMETGEVY